MDVNGVNKQNTHTDTRTHTHTHTHTHIKHSEKDNTGKGYLEKDDTPTPFLATPPFLWKKSESLLFRKFRKFQLCMYFTFLN